MATGHDRAESSVTFAGIRNKIKNFDEALYSRWCDHYFERLRGLMTR
jgi:hypothetical protein